VGVKKDFPLNILDVQAANLKFITFSAGQRKDRLKLSTTHGIKKTRLRESDYGKRLDAERLLSDKITTLRSIRKPTSAADTPL
jgi:hypothetical protein